MKSSKIVGSRSEGIEFPCLMELISSTRSKGIVALFTSPTEGMVVHTTSDSSYCIGHYQDTWVPCTEKHSWAPFKGTIALHGED
jgi:hypothetical protein